MAEATRGEFLTLSTVGIGAMIGVPATAYLLAPVTKEATFEPVFLGKVDQFTTETGFKPTPATFIEDPQNAATSPNLAFVHHTGSKNTDLRARVTVASTTRTAPAPPARRSARSTASSGRSRTATSSGSRSAGAPTFTATRCTTTR